MAQNKITTTVTLKLVSPGGTDTLTATVTTDQVGSNFSKETQLITTADAIQLDIPSDIADGKLGQLMIRNMSAVANPTVALADETYIDIALDEPMVNKIARVRPQECHLINSPAGTSTLFLQAHGADVPIIFFAIEL